MTTSHPTLIFLDCETCDFAGGVLSLAMNRVPSFDSILTTSESEFKASGKQATFKNPKPISPEAFAIHGISEESVADKDFYAIDEFYGMMYSLLSDDYSDLDPTDSVILVGHNIMGFDIRVLDIAAPFSCIDTMILARKLCSANILKHNQEPMKLGNKLDTLVGLYCSESAAHLQEFHDAGQDNYKAFVFLRFLMQKILPNSTVDNLVTLCLSSAPGVSKTDFKNIQTMLLSQGQGNNDATQ